ncbi:hypothetical protein [Neisseria leonii]|uniref:hypothetical protein n=1 Tax=Neisseria leonii TaxID=2995413 RepID=UPI00237B51B3|nr:hypothetical protein [Neisseria sp. 3986]MDD9324824.1 hypothetical protein [Neisseria sp. 3986]
MLKNYVVDLVFSYAVVACLFLSLFYGLCVSRCWSWREIKSTSKSMLFCSFGFMIGQIYCAREKSLIGVRPAFETELSLRGQLLICLLIIHIFVLFYFLEKLRHQEYQYWAVFILATMQIVLCFIFNNSFQNIEFYFQLVSNAMYGILPALLIYEAIKNQQKKNKGISAK